MQMIMENDFPKLKALGELAVSGNHARGPQFENHWFSLLFVLLLSDCDVSCCLKLLSSLPGFQQASRLSG